MSKIFISFFVLLPFLSLAQLQILTGEHGFAILRKK